MKITKTSLLLLAFLGCTPDKEISMRSYKEMEAFFQRYGYTFQTWRAGFRAVPRAYVADVPQRWAKVADQISLQKKKEVFYSAMLPLVLRANEIILEDRKRFEPIAMQIVAGAPVSEEDRTFLRDLAARYRIKGSTSDAHLTRELFLRVDMIPPSLALAQSALESGYATSRFAGLGNALFGQHTYDGKGMDPKGKRSHPYQLAAFESPLDSTMAYAFNLNTHRAYEKFRQRRAEYRKSGKFPDSAALAATLLAYSERGVAYTKDVAGIIRRLNLTQADQAFLREMEPVYLVPKPSDP